MMSIATDIKKLQESLEKLQFSLNNNGVHQNINLNDDIRTLIDVFQCPVFDSILNVQQSLQQLKEQVKIYPSILPVDFDISPSTLELRLTVPTENDNAKVKQNSNSDVPYYSGSDVENNFDYDSRTIPSKFSLQKYIYDSNEIVHQEPDYVNISLQDYAFRKGISELAQGRYVQTVELFKPEGQSLGFKVVGLNKDNKLGIYIQEIHENGIAAKNGLLKPDDQILAIDQHTFTSDLSHEDAINILQGANGIIQLVVARSDSSNNQQTKYDYADSTNNNQTLDDTSKPVFVVKRSPSEVSDSSKDSYDMVLNTEWTQIECIELENDGTGLGFGIIGGRSSGVIVKTLVPGGVADKDNHLQIGDHILQINSVNMRGMGSDQVAQILRQSGSQIKLIVARPVDPTSDLQVIQNTSTIVPTRSLNDTAELQKQIQCLQQPVQESLLPNDFSSELNHTFDLNSKDSDTTTTKVLHANSFTSSNDLTTTPLNSYQELENETVSPEMETFEVELVKDQQGLGITIAGYVCEKAEEISGIFIKSIAVDSVADKCNKVQINDQIIEVDGRSLYGYNNLQAVDLLRSTGKVVKLKLARYLKGFKYDQINKGVIRSETNLNPINSVDQNPYLNSSTVIQINNNNSYGINSAHLSNSKSTNELIEKWSQIVDIDSDIIVANVTKFCHDRGLGISLEGTIDIENGKEVRPHHYINSILPTGPVGRNGLLKDGDELLEVNGIRLHGLRHSDVLPLLKDLPIEVQLVCARPKYADSLYNHHLPSDQYSNQAEQLENKSSIDRDYQDVLESNSQPFIDRLVKAKSDGSLAISPITSITSNTTSELSKLRSRSLEPLSGLAMWSNEPQIIELIKGDRGLGFSILDYQDPMNPSETVIVIRSLVPGGVAQQDGRLLPGDRLLFVNDQNLENTTLDHAVQALKGASKGIVVVGVAKPLPLPESTLHLAATTQKVTFEEIKNSFYSTKKDNDNDVDKGNFDDEDITSDEDEDNLVLRNIQPLVAKVESSEFSLDPGNQSSSLDDEKDCSQPTDVIFSQSNLKRDSTNDSDNASALPLPTTSPSSSVSSKTSFTSKDDVAPTVLLPLKLEKNIYLRKKNSYLGMVLSLAENAENGYVVKNLDQNGLIFQDGRILVSDFIVALNDNSLRNATKDQVISILHECQLSHNNDLNIKYIPNVEADIYKQRFLNEMKTGLIAEQTVSSVSNKCIFPKSTSDSLNNDLNQQMSVSENSPISLSTSISTDQNMNQLESKLNSPGASSLSSDNSNSIVLNSAFKRQWGDVISIELTRDENKGFGISIIGGKDNKLGLASLTGILIKKILPDSPAAKSATLRTGDRLLEVGGIDLRNATHDEAVEAIKNAKSPVKFVVQSLIQINKVYSNGNSEKDEKNGSYLSSLCAYPDQSDLSSSNDDTQLRDSKHHLQNNQNEEDSAVISNSFDDTEGAAHVKLSQHEIEESIDEELTEDQYGYSSKKIKKKYSDINGSTLLVDLHKGLTGLGISLAGNRDRTKMSVFVCGMHPKGSAFKDGRLQIGDEILEVNGIVLYGRSHLNASAIIKSLACPTYRIIVLRRDGALDEMAVKPLTQFPVHLEDFLEEKYCKFKGVRTITVRKGSQGLGIMIIEGKHSELGRGVFVSDIQEGSAAECAGLSVGDMVLCVNQTDLIGADYDTAANALKCAEGLLTLVIAKPGKAANFESPTSPCDGIKKSIEFSLDSSIPQGKCPPLSHPMPEPSTNAPTTIPNLTSDQNEVLDCTSHLNGLIKRDAPKPSDIATSCTSTITVADNVSSTSNSQLISCHSLSSLSITESPVTNIAVSTSLIPSISLSTAKVQFTDSFKSNNVNNIVLSSANMHPNQDKAQSNLGDHQSDFKTCQVKTGEETTIEIVREKLGLGLSIVGGSDTPLNAVIIHEVYPDGAADLDGRLKPGDQILDVNGEDLRHAPHEKAIKALRQTPPVIKMKVYREGSDINCNDNYEVFDIRLVKKPGKGLGLSIVGKRDGSGIFVSEIVKGGIADMDGRLMIGDQIVQVNGQDLINIEQEDAAVVLKTAKGVINLKIGRFKYGTQMNSTNSKCEELSADETKEIEIEKGQDGLGFSIVGGYGSVHGNLPICVRKIFDKGSASEDGRLREGDILLAVNDLDLTAMTHDQVVEILKNVTGKVKLLVYETN